MVQGAFRCSRNLEAFLPGPELKGHKNKSTIPISLHSLVPIGWTDQHRSSSGRLVRLYRRIHGNGAERLFRFMLPSVCDTVFAVIIISVDGGAGSSCYSRCQRSAIRSHGNVRLQSAGRRHTSTSKHVSVSHTEQKTNPDQSGWQRSKEMRKAGVH